jgi:hypothetical protein
MDSGVCVYIVASILDQRATTYKFICTSHVNFLENY